MRIVITENQLKRLIENKDTSEYLADDFHTDVKKFVKDLLSSPANAEIPERLKNRDINRNKLIDALIEKGFLTRKQTVKEVEKDGKKVSRMMTIYSANLDNGSQKIEEVRKSLFESKDNEEVMDEETLFEIETDEVDETVSAGGANTGADGAGQVLKGCGLGVNPKDPTFGRDFTPEHTDVIRREGYNANRKNKKQ